MPVIEIIIVIAIVGVILWAVNQYVPMAAPVKNVLNIVVIIILVIWLLRVFGLFTGGLRI
jgi:hypothetical protein